PVVDGPAALFGVLDWRQALWKAAACRGAGLGGRPHIKRSRGQLAASHLTGRFRGSARDKLPLYGVACSLLGFGLPPFFLCSRLVCPPDQRGGLQDDADRDLVRNSDGNGAPNEADIRFLSGPSDPLLQYPRANLSGPASHFESGAVGIDRGGHRSRLVLAPHP